MPYTTLEFFENEIFSWDISGEMTSDLIAGIFVALHAITRQFNRSTYYVMLNDIRIEIPLHDLAKELPDYYITTYEPITNDNIWTGEENNKFRIAIKDLLDEVKVAQVFSFATYDFIQGFINTMDNTGLDFRDYLIGPPFKIINRKPVFFNIEGYDIPLANPVTRIPAPVGAFYTGAYEADAYGEDFD